MDQGVEIPIAGGAEGDSDTTVSYLAGQEQEFSRKAKDRGDW